MASPRECGPTLPATYTFTFSLHHPGGPSTTAASGHGAYNDTNMDVEYSHALSEAGDYTATEDAYCSNPGNHVIQNVDFTVGAGLGGSITVSPDPPVANQQAALDGGSRGRQPRLQLLLGSQRRRDLRRRDHAQPQLHVHDDRSAHRPRPDHGQPGRRQQQPHPHGDRHQDHRRRRALVEPAAAAAPAAVRQQGRLQALGVQDHGLLHADLLFARHVDTTSAVTLNGIMLPDFGQTFTITGPTAGEPGGHFTAPSSTMQLDGFKVFSGNIDWSLPDGGPGQEKVIPGRSFAVAAGAALLGLNVRGIDRAGARAGRRRHATTPTFPLNVELPASFTAGPDPALRPRHRAARRCASTTAESTTTASSCRQTTSGWAS